MFDWVQLQCGFKVYVENCLVCYVLSCVVFCNLVEDGGLGFIEDQVKVIVVDYIVVDGLDDFGDMFDCLVIFVDCFLFLFLNEQVVWVVNNGVYLFDFFLLVKVCVLQCGFLNFVFDIFIQYQENGLDYIYLLLIGYVDLLEGKEVLEGQYYNYFFLVGEFIFMVLLFWEEVVEYMDGILMIVENYVWDVFVFMMWVVELYLEEWKKMGFWVMIFLIVFVGFLYFIKKQVW